MCEFSLHLYFYFWNFLYEKYLTLYSEKKIELSFWKSSQVFKIPLHSVKFFSPSEVLKVLYIHLKKNLKTAHEIWNWGSFWVFFMKETHTKVKTSVLCHFQKDSTSCAGALVQYLLRGMNTTSWITNAFFYRTWIFPRGFESTHRQHWQYSEIIKPDKSCLEVKKA